MANILIVDDEPDVLYLVEKILMKDGHAVKTADSGRNSLEMLKKGEKPDLIFMDVMMPGENGWEICRKIKENPDYKDIKVAILTIRGEEEDKKESMEYAMADMHINKPFRRDEITKSVKKLMSEN